MRISTKTGDGGLTSLLYGGRVKKASLRIEACGALDELNSFLGLNKSLLNNRQAKRLIDKIQRDLFIIGSEIATSASSVHKLHRRIKKEDIKTLELFIEKLEKKDKVKKFSFVLPGRNTISAQLDIARTVARRAERRTATLKNKGMLKNKYILMYLNRLSDLLFLLARSCEKKRRKKRF